MKHLFYVHSHITNLIARQIIRQFDLDKRFCIFLLGRNFQVDFEHCVVFPFTDFPLQSASELLFPWKQKKKLRQFDEWLSSTCNKESFHFYTPHSVNIITHLVFSHPLCQAYSYIEEGKATYLDVERLNVLYPKERSILKRVLYFFNFHKRVPDKRPFYDTKNPKYKNAYTIDASGFPGLSNKILLEKPFSLMSFEDDYEHLIIIGPFVENMRFQLSTYKIVLAKLLDWMIKAGIERTHLKFHPAQREGSIMALKKVIQSKAGDIEVIELGKEAVLENIAIGTSCNFYCILSSAGIYAAMAGNKVYSIAKSVLEIEPKFKKVLDNTPFVLTDRIIFLEGL